MFDTKPKLKINIADNNQTFIPFFTGNLNFIASDTNNYWHLHIRFPKTNIFYTWPTLIYTEDIAILSIDIENVILKNRNHFYDQELLSLTKFSVLLASCLKFTVREIIPFANESFP